jgi:hypothetical protein
MRTSGTELFFVSDASNVSFFFVTGFFFFVTGELFFVSDAFNGFWNIHHVAVHSGDAAAQEVALSGSEYAYDYS